MKSVPVLIVALVPASLALAMAFGSVEMSASQLAHALLGRGDEIAREIVWRARAPRALAVCLGGSLLTLADVLVQDPEILLLDEPLQHLDLRHQAQVMRTLSACASAGKSVLMALHEPGYAMRYCGFSVLLYDAGRTSLGRSSDMLTQANLEALYHCRLDTASAQNYLPA